MYQVYSCEYCRTLDKKEAIEKHELACNYNPTTKSCQSCKNNHLHTSRRCCMAGVGVKINCEGFEYLSNCDKYVHGKPRITRSV